MPLWAVLLGAGMGVGVSWWMSRRSWTKYSVLLCFANAAAALVSMGIAVAFGLWLAACVYALAVAGDVAFANRASYVRWRHLLTRDGRRLAACRWRMTRGKEPLVFYADGKMTPVFMAKTLADMMAERRSAERPSGDTPERP